MQNNPWIKSFVGTITVCDPEGIILEMNEQSAKEFETQGGAALIGTNLLDCHPEPSRSKLKIMLAEKNENIYTIEKKGKKKLIYQTPWYKDGEYAGFIEMILPLPAELPHFPRD
jgi:transcriptional regulator with PAS, ATPase and Fis domain